MVAMLTRAACTLLSDYDLITDYDLRVLLATIADYDLRTYKYVSPTLVAKNHKLASQGTSKLRVANSLKRLVASNILQAGPRVYVHRGQGRDYQSGHKYATYRLNPTITLATKLTADYVRSHQRREHRMELSPLRP